MKSRFLFLGVIQELNKQTTTRPQVQTTNEQESGQLTSIDLNASMCAWIPDSNEKGQKIDNGTMKHLPALMETEVRAGIEKFKSECSRQLPGVALVIPVRPTGANFLISLTYEGQRTYITIHEDDFADWGEASDLSKVAAAATAAIKKLKDG